MLLAVGGPAVRIEQRLQGDPVGDGDELFGERWRAGLVDDAAADSELGGRRAELAVGVALGGGQLLVACGLGAEGDGDHPVPAAFVVEGERAFERGEQCVSRRSRSRASRAMRRCSNDDVNVNSRSSRLSAK